MYTSFAFAFKEIKLVYCAAGKPSSSSRPVANSGRLVLAATQHGTVLLCKQPETL